LCGGRKGGARWRGGWACSWRRPDVKVEVDERVEPLERERLRLLVVDEHTLPFLRGLLVALEYYHLVVVDCGSLNSNRSNLPAGVYLERAWLGRVYRCGLVVVAKGIKVSLWEGYFAFLRWWLSLAGLEGLGEGLSYANIVPSCGRHPRGGGGRH